MDRGNLVAGRYEIVRLLGRGAAKEVFLADDRLTGEPVALAVLRPQVEYDDTLTARFEREGRIGIALRSPYIVAVVDHGVLDRTTHYLVTEAVLGRSLADALEGGAVSPDLAARWVGHVLAGLSGAHKMGIVHRDIKPDNVLLGRSADGEVAKLTDFGIAKLLDTRVESAPAALTAANVLIGTPQYMPPEQWQSMTIDARSDLYAVGVMLYELLIGAYPFDADSLEALCYAHVALPPRPFPTDGPSRLRALEPVILRALAKEPDERYASADEMLAAIETASGIVIDRNGPPGGLVFPARFARAELLSDLWPASIQLIVAPRVVLGRSDRAELTVRCLPDTPENALLTRAISGEHAVIEWRGGHAWLTDLHSRGGTSVNDTALTPGVATVLSDGDVIGVGMQARFLFEQPAVTSGALPPWARLTRTDAWGEGRQHVLVLTEAPISADPEAAICVPADIANGQAVTFWVGPKDLVVSAHGARPESVRDGQIVHV